MMLIVSYNSQPENHIAYFPCLETGVKANGYIPVVTLLQTIQPLQQLARLTAVTPPTLRLHPLLQVSFRG